MTNDLDYKEPTFALSSQLISHASQCTGTGPTPMGWYIYCWIHIFFKIYVTCLFHYKSGRSHFSWKKISVFLEAFVAYIRAGPKEHLMPILMLLSLRSCLHWGRLWKYLLQSHSISMNIPFLTHLVLRKKSRATSNFISNFKIDQTIFIE